MSEITRQHRKALWHNGCTSHNLLRRLTLTHDLDNKRGVAKECKNEKHKINLTQSIVNEQKRDMRGPKFTLGALHFVEKIIIPERCT